MGIQRKARRITSLEHSSQQNMARPNEAEECIDMKVRCIENNNIETTEEDTISNLKNLIVGAEKEVVEAEEKLIAKKDILRKLQSELETKLIKSVSQLKPPAEKSTKENSEKTEKSKDVSKRWKMAGLKARLGTGGLSLPRRRDLNNADTFIVKESEEASKEDQMDLEGKCMRKTKDKRYFRKSGVGVGSTQGRDCAW